MTDDKKVVRVCEAPGDGSVSRTAVSEDAYTIYFPIAFAPPPAKALPPVQADEFLLLLKSDRRQRRQRIERCRCLSEAAQKRAIGLATVEPWSHVDAAGVTPNEHVRNAGCLLPDSYPRRGNNVELLAAGSEWAWAIFAALAAGEKHYVALFACERNGETNTFFAAQQSVGIGIAAGGEMGWYWCIMFAQCLGGC